jgi:hypothetical protein
MEYTMLGNTGLRVSRFGLGCMRFPEHKEDAISMVRHAIDNGVNYLDSAYIYKDSEEITGEALQNGYRHNIILATKSPIWNIQSHSDFEKYLDEELLCHCQYITPAKLSPPLSDNQGMIRVFLCALVLSTLTTEIGSQEPLRGQVWVELEPLPGQYVDDPGQADIQSIRRRALEEASLFFSQMIYGWSFHYDIGERARNIDEKLELTLRGSIVWGDPGLIPTDTGLRDNRFYMWADFWPNAVQQRWLSVWKTGTIRTAQAIGHGPLGGVVEIADWTTIKQTALEDAARAAIRAMLRAVERNRPKAVDGFISLAAFPVFYMDAGQWAASGRFRVNITEITPFAAY